MKASRRGLLLASAVLAWCACGGRVAEESRGAAEASRARAAPASAPVEKCPWVASDATVWLLGAERGTGAVDAVEVTPVAFDRRPEVGSEVWVLPYPQGPAVRLKVRGAERAEAGPRWLVRLEDARETSLRDLHAPPGRRPEAPSDAAVVWPAPEAAPQILTVHPADLPADLAAGTVNVAVDVDRDGRADLLIAEFCCGDRASRSDCEYYCGETWQRTGARWRRCSSWQPA